MLSEPPFTVAVNNWTSISRWMGKEVVVLIYNGIFRRYKKDRFWVSSNEVDESRAYHRQWSKLQSQSESEGAQSYPTLFDPMDWSLPGSSVHGIFQARILKWVTISFSRASSWPRDWTQVFHLTGRRFTVWATRKVTDSEVSHKEEDKYRTLTHINGI